MFLDSLMYRSIIHIFEIQIEFQKSLLSSYMIILCLIQKL